MLQTEARFAAAKMRAAPVPPVHSDGESDSTATPGPWVSRVSRAWLETGEVVRWGGGGQKCWDVPILERMTQTIYCNYIDL